MTQTPVLVRSDFVRLLDHLASRSPQGTVTCGLFGIATPLPFTLEDLLALANRAQSIGEATDWCLFLRVEPDPAPSGKE